MKTYHVQVCTLLVSLAFLAPPASAENILVDFESQTPRNPNLGSNFWNPNPGMTSGNVTFSGGSYEGFVSSNSTVTGTGGFLYPQAFAPGNATAEISAESHGGAGGGVGSPAGGNFAVGSGAGITIDLPAGHRPLSMYVTNTATTAYLLANTDPNGFASPMAADGNEFGVTFHGWSGPSGTGTELGTVHFVLGSFLSGNATIVKEWTELNLASLGNAASMSLSFNSYDMFGPYINTPTYVALDNLTIAPVPEPGTWALIAVAAAGGFMMRRRNLSRR